MTLAIFPRPTGDLQGATSSLPDRGTGTGMEGDAYGADLSAEATNRIVGISGYCKSDPMMEEEPINQTEGRGASDATEDAKEGADE